ncbi:hypothetical protein UlMin_023579 [Ulmus minor]
MAATSFIFSCSSNVIHSYRKNDPSYPRSFLGIGHGILAQSIAKGNQNNNCYGKYKLSCGFTVYAVTKGKHDVSLDGFEFPFFVYLLSSAITTIAVYVKQRPVFGIVNTNSIFYPPLLGFFTFTGIPTLVSFFPLYMGFESRPLGSQSGEEAQSNAKIPDSDKTKAKQKLYVESQALEFFLDNMEVSFSCLLS